MRFADLETAGRALADRVIERTLARFRLSPSVLTVGGTLVNIAVAALLSYGHLRWAACLMLLAAGFDVADGALARVTGRQSELGAFLDSTLDRYSEALIGLGLMIHLLQRGAWLDLVLLYLFMSGSLVFSYTRARAQAEGFSTHAGLFTRLVRLLVLAIGLLAGQLRIALWALAAGVQLSAVQRLLGICAEARRRAPPGEASPVKAWLMGLFSHRPLGVRPYEGAEAPSQGRQSQSR